MKVKKNKEALLYLSFLLAATVTELDAVSEEKAPPENAKSAPIVGHGTIEVIDLDKRQLTIKHDAIEALNWPPMTMSFPAAEKLDISQWKVGDNINFQLEKDKANQIIHIEKADNQKG